MRSAPRDGRPDPESFNAIDTYTCSKKINVHMRDGSLPSSLMVNAKEYKQKAACIYCQYYPVSGVVVHE